VVDQADQAVALGGMDEEAGRGHRGHTVGDLDRQGLLGVGPHWVVEL